MTFSQEIEQQKRVLRLKNIQQTRKEIKSPWVKEKIQKYAKAYGGLFSEEQIRQQILENDLVASMFCKGPAKQNISEKLAEKYLKTNKFPAQGKNCIRFNDEGDIVSSCFGNTKSADFYIKGYYATQKYTVETGGAQDNQRNDVIDFLKRGSIKHKVAAIVDGPYWDKQKAFLQKQFAGNPNVLITSIGEIA